MNNYDWNKVLTVPNYHKWFKGTHPVSGERRLAVCDDSGDTPDQTDDGTIWLRGRVIVLLEDLYEVERRNSFRWCKVLMRGEKDDGTPVHIGGTGGPEALKLHETGLAEVLFTVESFMMETV